MSKFKYIEIDCCKMQCGGVVCRDSAGAVMAIFPSWYSNKPDYRNKYVTINCFKYKIKWNK